MIKNAHLYCGYDDFPSITSEQIEQAIRMLQFAPVGSQSVSSTGFEPVVEGGPFALDIDTGVMLFRLREDRKQIPGPLLKRLVNERVGEIQENEGRKVGRKERAEIKEAITFSLLPQAFPKTTTTFGWLDCRVTPWRVIVGASSANRADEFVTKLRQAFGSLPCALPAVKHSPVAIMSEWVRGDGAGPGCYSVSDSAELEGSDDAKVKFDGVNVANDEEVKAFLECGFGVTTLGLINDDGVEFSLTHRLEVKKIKAEIEYEGDGDALDEMRHRIGVTRLLLNDVFSSVFDSMGGLSD